MRKLPYKTWLLAGILALVPFVAQGAGLGKLTILSTLGQPLSAEIDLVAVQKDEVSSLAIRLAPQDTFTKANIEFSPALIGARFTIDKRSDGQPYVKITSTRSVNEPFVNILVELSWSRGRLVREYTALIDPPNLVPTPVAAAPIEPPTMAAPAAAPEPARIAAPAASTAAAPAVAVAKPAPPPAKPASPQVAAKPDNRDYGPVKRGETLSRIASSLKPDGVTLEQMLVGLFRSNPDAFVGNMNRLKAGQILRVPEREKLADTVPQDAVKEVRIQAANWNAYRQKIADAAGNVPASESRSVARGKIAAVDDKAATKDTPKEVVKLSKGESAPVSGKTDKGGAVSAKDRMRALEDEAIVREKALAEANSRVSQLEKNIKDMQRLLELKGGAPGLKPEPTPPAKAEPAKAAPAKAEPPKAAEPPKDAAKTEPTKDIAKAELAKDAKAEPAKDATKIEPAKDAEKAPDAPKAATAPKPKPVVVPPPPPEPDLLDQLTSDPLYMAGGAGILALLGVGGYVMVRRRRAGANDDEQKKTEPRKVVMAGNAAATPMAVAPVVAQAMVDDVDPLAEADLYLNFGRDAQAEEVLKDALAKNPNHQEAKLKLLQIFAGRKDKDAFETLAKDLNAQTGGIGDNWLKAAGMGYALDAGNALYAAGSSAPAAELPASGGAAGTDLDFDLELAPDGKAAGATTDIELDVGKTMIMQPGQLAGLAAGGDPSTTRDITSDSGIARAAAESADAVAPDFTLNVPAVKPADAAEPDLTLDAPGSDEMTQSNLKLGAGAGGNMIDFNFDSTAIIPPAAEAPPEKGYTHDKTVVMSPDNPDNPAVLDVDLGTSKSAKVAGDAPPMLPELKFDDINLNFDESKAGAAKELAAGDAGTKDDHWYDVQTKFDLAKAYQEMGDKDGTREILLEVIKEGDAAQQTEAKALLDSLG